MKQCTNCGKEYGDDNAFCPYCDERYGDTALSDDVISGVFPEYVEEENHIIGKVNDSSSFAAHKLEVYQRNSLIAREEEVVREAEETDLAKTQQTQIDRRAEEIKLRRLNKNLLRTGIAAILFIVLALSAYYAFGVVLQKSNDYEQLRSQNSASTEVIVTEHQNVIEVPDDSPVTTIVSAATYLPEERQPLEADSDQLKYNDENISALMSAANMEKTSEEGIYQLYICYEMKNVSEQSFDIMPSKLALLTKNDTEIYGSEGTPTPDYYTLEPGAVLSKTMVYNCTLDEADTIKSIVYRPDTTVGSRTDAAENLYFKAYQILPDHIRDFIKQEKNTAVTEAVSAVTEAPVTENITAATDAYGHPFAQPFSKGDGQYVVSDGDYSYAISMELTKDRSYALVNVKARNTGNIAGRVFANSFSFSSPLSSGSGSVMLKPQYLRCDRKYFNEQFGEPKTVSSEDFDGTLYDSKTYIYFDENNEADFTLIINVEGDQFNQYSVDTIDRFIYGQYDDGKYFDVKL